jgi:hypothetical protein
MREKPPRYSDRLQLCQALVDAEAATGLRDMAAWKSALRGLSVSQRAMLAAEIAWPDTTPAGIGPVGAEHPNPEGPSPMPSPEHDETATLCGVIRATPELFRQLPPHPGQRNIADHAGELARSGVLKHRLPMHEQVAAVVVIPGGVPALDAFKAKLAHDGMEALFHHRATKLNGHTRDYLWAANQVLAPPTLELTVYAVISAAESQRLYDAYDSKTSVKTVQDAMQSTLRQAGIIDPRSQLIAKASGFKRALDHAVGILHGTHDTPAVTLSQERLEQLVAEGAPAAKIDLYRQLPYLAAVEYFKSAILALDAFCLTGRTAPISPPFLGAYLVLLQDQPTAAARFMGDLIASEGEQGADLMDAVYVVKNVKTVFSGKRITGAKRAKMAVCVVLNAFVGWRHKHSWPAKRFPASESVLRKFQRIFPPKETKEKAVPQRRAATPHRGEEAAP